MRNINRIFQVLLLAVMTFTAVACSSDDEPENNKASEQAAWIRQAVLDNNGEIAFPASTRTGVYLLPAEDAGVARSLCEGIIGREWDGKALRLSLDDKGSVNLAPSTKEGVYYELVFNVKDIPGFSLEVAGLEYCDSENSRPVGGGGRGGYWKCTNSGCGHVFYQKPSKCSFCGGTQFTYRANSGHTPPEYS